MKRVLLFVVLVLGAVLGVGGFKENVAQASPTLYPRYFPGRYVRSLVQVNYTGAAQELLIIGKLVTTRPEVVDGVANYNVLITRTRMIFNPRQTWKFFDADETKLFRTRSFRVPYLMDWDGSLYMDEWHHAYIRWEVYYADGTPVWAQPYIQDLFLGWGEVGFLTLNIPGQYVPPPPPPPPPPIVYPVPVGAQIRVDNFTGKVISRIRYSREAVYPTEPGGGLDAFVNISPARGSAPWILLTANEVVTDQSGNARNEPLRPGVAYDLQLYYTDGTKESWYGTAVGGKAVWTPGAVAVGSGFQDN